MDDKIKVAAVSYLNTKPLLYGIERSSITEEIDLILEFPSAIAKHLQENTIDLGLVPVAAIPHIPNARIISSYGIAADGEVASVSIFSRCPMEEIEVLYLDYQSRTSVRLAQVLMERHWGKKVIYRDAPEDYIQRIGGKAAGVIIGDRALKQNDNFPYLYDLAEHWKMMTGLPFVFAAWVANKELSDSFVKRFDEANALGLDALDEIIGANPFLHYDLGRYYRENIQYKLGAEHRKGLDLFLSYLKD